MLLERQSKSTKSDFFWKFIKIAPKTDLISSLLQHHTQFNINMTSTRPRHTPNPLCTSSSCDDDKSKDVLTCSKCNRRVHFICTRLPPYMISACNDGRQKCIYKCPNCVNVSKDVLAIVPPPGSQPSLKTAAQLSKYKETIKENEETIKKLKTTEQHLLQIVETQNEEMTELKKKLANDPAFHTV